MKKGDKIRFNGHQGGGSFTYDATTVGKIYEITDMSNNPLYEGRAYYKGDDGNMYVWKRDREDVRNDFTLVQAEQIKPKIGDKIRFTGDEFEYSNTTRGKEYEIRDVTNNLARYFGDGGKICVWNYNAYPNDFTLVPAQNTVPAERDLDTLQEGDIIKFMGAPIGANRYRDTTIGKEYEITETLTESGKIVVKYRDDVGDLVSWKPSSYNQIYYFKVMSEQRVYKDDALATAPTLQDLKTTLDMALLLNDIQWAQETYEQIQQMEGEHA